jgi:flagellar protein FliS
MRQTNGATAYQEAKIMSSSREQLVVLLYEHLLANLRRAAVQIERKDVEGRTKSLERASDIVFELLSALDMDAGGELASRLAALYGYFIGEISAVGRTLETQRLERLTALVSTLHGSWSQVAAAAVPAVRSEAVLA